MASAGKKRKSVMKRYVHADLVREILVCLPCKSLSRFKSVSKLFSSFPEDVQFIEEHRKRNMKPSHYLTWDTTDETKLHVFSLSSDKYSHIKTIQTYKYAVALPSSYGLVCLHGGESKSIALLNPVSGTLVSLPDLPRPFAFQTKNNPGSLTPTTCRHNDIGFGLDLQSHKYKVVQFVLNLYTYAISHCYVLTVNVNGSSWRQIDVSNKTDNIYFEWQPIYADGVLYWEMATIRHDMFIQVFVFHLSTEKMSVIESPSKYRYDKFGHGKHLTLLEGKLACVEMTPPVDMLFVMKIWKLINHDAFKGHVSWLLSYKLDIYGYSRPLYPLYINDDDDHTKRIICSSFGDLYRYDIQSKCLEIYPVREKVEGVACYTYTNLSTIYSETIIPTPIPLL